MAEKNEQEKARNRWRAMDKKYTVRAGDSWFKIAGQLYADFFGGDTLQAQRMAQELARANAGISNLRPGMVIKLPSPVQNPYMSARFGAPAEAAAAVPVSGGVSASTPTAVAGAAPAVPAAAPAAAQPMGTMTATPASAQPMGTTANTPWFVPPSPPPIQVTPPPPNPAGSQSRAQARDRRAATRNPGAPAFPPATFRPTTPTGRTTGWRDAGAGGRAQANRGPSVPSFPQNAPANVMPTPTQLPDTFTQGYRRTAEATAAQIAAGVFPLTISAGDVWQLGLTDAQLQAAGYRRQTWGGWARWDAVTGASTRSGSGAGSYRGSYGRGGGGGGGGSAAATLRGLGIAGPGFPRIGSSPTGRSYDPNMNGLVSWRI